ncbi:NAD(P)/FAD-dependent oxidoreductase [Candidatus Woesearchaeota archaeon]|nr:NAD(P)/FAD-dependent oxidoreductase [Candidatus Woesearchaeota archaeon]
MADVYATIIGAGVTGMTIAYELSQFLNPGDFCLLEKEKTFPSDNQSSRNSGVIHAGIYYDQKHSPLKASLCVLGNELLYRFCETNNIASKQTGKLIVATNSDEDNTLDVLLARAHENNVPGVRKITSREVERLEPNVSAYSALYLPTSGIIDPLSLVQKLKDFSGLEQYFFKGTEVLALREHKNEIIITASSPGNPKYEISTKYLINAAGLYSDKIAKMLNPDFPLSIFPVRGEALKFTQNRPELIVSRNVYPVPTTIKKSDGSSHLTLGVHLTPTISSDISFASHLQEISVGPLNRKSGSVLKLNDFASDLAPHSVFLEKVKPYFPALQLEDLKYHQVGIQAVLSNGLDFHISPDNKHARMINLVGICSPGLTSSLAIVKMVKNIILPEKTNGPKY